MVEKGLFTFLTGQSAITTALGGNKVYPNKAPQNAGTRYIVYKRVTNVPVRVLRGSAGIKRALFQLDFYGATYDEAKSVWQLAVTAVTENGLPNPGGAAVTWDGHSISCAFFEDDIDEYVAPQTSDDVGKHVVSADLVVWYSV